MKKIALLSFLFIISVSSLQAQSSFRRGNGNPYFGRLEFNIVDNFDNSPFAPTYKWADTTNGTWLRVTGWSNTDDGVATLPMTYDSINFLYFFGGVWVLQPPHTMTDPQGNVIPIAGTSISTNATIDLFGRDSSPVNTSVASIAGAPLVAPLWADWEFRTTGDSSKVYVRVAAPDSFYVSFYNLGLKGTNGKVTATFQVLFCARDSSITFFYKSFDGSFDNIPAATLIQRTATIGVFDPSDNIAVLYLHKGNYFATSTTPSYAQPLQNGLAVKFFRASVDAFQITTVTMPPNDRYENPSNTITPACRIQNLADTTIKVFVRTLIVNTSTGSGVYNKFDSIIVGNNSTTTYTAPQYTNLVCGSYKITFTISYRNDVSDYWSGNNTFTRYFVVLSNQSSPFREEFESGVSPCMWSNDGAETRTNVMYVPSAAPSGPVGPAAAILNRLDANGQPYPLELGGDTLTSAPIDLSNAGSNVNLFFHYQRGLNTDSSQAGILKRAWAGPEMPIRGAAGGMAQLGDTLIVEGLLSTGPRWNPVESDWGQLGIITGGFDVKPQIFRAQIPSAMLSDHFRVRFRVKARDALAPKNFLEDADNFVVDAIHVEPFQAHKTELEPIDVDLGNGIYTHVPRNLVGGLQPSVRIRNNGDGVEIGLSVLHLRIFDALGRVVYDRTRAFDFPSPLTDSTFPMPAWDIRGSQGGTFSANVVLEAVYYDAYIANDTNIFRKQLFIDSTYAVDDGKIDTLNGTTVPATNFYYDFKSASPAGYDTLRGVMLYFTGPSTTSSWLLTISWGNSSTTRNFSVSPTSAGWWRGGFAFPFIASADTVYRFHFVQSTGTNFGGDASRGLVYYTYVDSSNSGNNQYGELYPEVLNHFTTSSGASYTQPTPSVADAGGYLLPMFRLITSGSSTYLPVKLASLAAHRAPNGAVAIQWKTAMEDGEAGYMIERVEPTHTVVGVVNATNLSTGSEYSLTDMAAPREEATYSLTEIGIGGSNTVLCRVTVAQEQSPEFSISATPNPSSRTIVITASDPIESIDFYDPTGRIAKSVVANGRSAAIGVATIPAGAYEVEVRSNERSARTKVIIVH